MLPATHATQQRGWLFFGLMTKEEKDELNRILDGVLGDDALYFAEIFGNGGKNEEKVVGTAKRRIVVCR